jgi:hypothetical protein
VSTHCVRGRPEIYPNFSCDTLEMLGICLAFTSAAAKTEGTKNEYCYEGERC